ncbi:MULTISPECIES: biotin--[acetyl-CoA-carboxylase] ligase [Metallosphaera]|uniref:Biotin--acetyl-CoA-carboxylase ligase n=1 Tax=Metallosphaera cuprina (strain Ar-4) TaxID=1006006 RepID=F4FZ76_METCR|nr:biotin--[acetyl-CoA-carboxylase] ligase [Metallosphaera cuprina]AEB94385.1 biotin--acetyl-CoA-carboxylase ligase [Metallosphaera cuprina Ar-4]
MQIVKLTRVTSTQDFAEAVSEMIDENYVVVAEEQTRARGRYRRAWYSPKGGLWVTYVIKDFNVEEIALTTLRVALAIRSVLSKYVNSTIRWPNDVVVNGKKISGVLVESSVQGSSSVGFIGFGINSNVSVFPQDINATSVKLETGKEIDNQLLLDEVIQKINQYITKTPEEVYSELNSNLYIKEKDVVLYGENWKKECKALFVDRYGRLVTMCGIFEVEEVLRLETP